MTGQVGAFKGEQQFTAAIVGLVEGKASKVYFTEGHGEHSLQDVRPAAGYGLVGQSLKNENIETANLNLAAKGDVPADADAVVIAGPSITFSPIEADALDKYVANNGKLLVLLDPYVNLGLDNLLKKYGLNFDDDLVLYRAADRDRLADDHPPRRHLPGRFLHAPHHREICAGQSSAPDPGRPLHHPPARDRHSLNPKTQFLLQTDADAWGWINKNAATAARSHSNSPSTRPPTSPGPLTIAAVYDGGTTPTQRPRPPCPPPASSPSAPPNSWKTTRAMKRSAANFFTNCLDWLVKKDAVLDIAPKKPQDYGVSLNPHLLPHRGLDAPPSSFPARPCSRASSPGSRAANNSDLRVMLRNSSTYIYLAVALGLFCYLAFIDKKIPGTKEREEAETQSFKFDPDDVTGLEITNVHGIFYFPEKSTTIGKSKSRSTPPPMAPPSTESSTRSPSPSPSASSRSTSSDKDQANLKEWGLSPAAERVVIHTMDKKVRTARRAQNGHQRQRLCPRLGPQK